MLRMFPSKTVGNSATMESMVGGKVVVVKMVVLSLCGLISLYGAVASVTEGCG